MTYEHVWYTIVSMEHWIEERGFGEDSSFGSIALKVTFGCGKM